MVGIQEKKNRDGFTSSLGVLAATVGSAVGLGNIWKFPVETGKNGGAAFIIIYLVCVALLALPILISEMSLGRKTRANAVTSFQKVAPGKPWFLVGILGVITNTLILTFYTTIAGWVYNYVFKAFTGVFSGASKEQVENTFGSLASGTIEPVIWQLIVLVVVALIIRSGIQGGIEKVTKVLMPVLFGLLLLLAIRGVMLPGAVQGVSFLFKPDFSAVTGATLASAMGLAFFKLSVGMGTMITYGSYAMKQQNLPKTATTVALADVSVSMLAGLAIFPAVFSFGFDVTGGPALLFNTIPMVFNSMTGGSIFLGLFFILAGIAATTASVSMFEVSVAFVNERFQVSRKAATFIMFGIIAVIGVMATLSNSPILSDIHLIKGKNLFDSLDYLTQYWTIPIGGLFIALFVGWKMKFEDLYVEISNEGTLNNRTFIKIYHFVIRYITPVLVAYVLLDGVGVISFIKGLLF